MIFHSKCFPKKNQPAENVLSIEFKEKELASDYSNIPSNGNNISYVDSLFKNSDTHLKK